MDKTYLYAVSSVRCYNNGEDRYYSTDDIFLSYDEALAFIRKDAAEALEYFRETFEDVPDDALDFCCNDYEDACISYAGWYFSWRIDTILDPRCREEQEQA